MRVHHIGYMVKNIGKAIEAFDVLGYKLIIPSTWDEDREAYICFLENNGYCIELISPSKESDLYPLLKQYSNSPYHMCYAVDDLEQAIKELEGKKFMMFKEPAPAPVIGQNAKVAFLMNARAGMIELVEES